MPLIQIQTTPTPAQLALAQFLKLNTDFYNSSVAFIESLNGLFYGISEDYTAQDLWALVGTNGAASLQILGLLTQALTIANPSYVAPAIPDTLIPNQDGTVTDTPPAPIN